MKHHSLNHSELEESDCRSDSLYSPKKCYLVKEVNSDIEDDDDNSEHEEIVNNLSFDRLKEVEEVEQMYNPRQGSIIIDEDGEKFLDCLSDEEDAKPDLTQSIDEEQVATAAVEDPKAKKLFKLKDTKSKVIYDHTTKQKRFMSPFEQFIAEQQELFKRDETRLNDEQNSVTMTTTASTNFDSKTVMLQSSSGYSCDMLIYL